MSKHTKLLAGLSLYGHLLFLMILIFEHFLRTELSPLSHYLSEYSLGKYGWIHIAAFSILSFAQVCLFLGLLQNIKVSILSFVTFALYTAGIIMVTVFPTDTPGAAPSSTGLIHGLSAQVAFIGFCIALFAWGANFGKNVDWKRYSKLSIWYGVISLLIFAGNMISPPAFTGLFQRILLLFNLSWLLLVSERLYDLGDRAKRRRSQ